MPTSLASDIIVIANIPSDHRSPYDKCPMYNARGHQRKYNIKQWYDHQIKQRIKTKPEATNKQNWYWFKHTEYYKEGGFIKYLQRLKADKPIKRKARKPPPITPSVHKQIANRISDILFQYKYESDEHMDILFGILNTLSDRGASPDIFKEFGIGDCIMTVLEIHRVFNILRQGKDTDARRIKQILLSAMIRLKSNDRIDNISLLRNISNEGYDNVKDIIIKNKTEFNEKKSLCLYDKEGLEQKTREVYSQRIYDHMDEYFHTVTSPDPNKRKTKKIFDKELNRKMPHPYHRHNGLFKNMHSDWVERACKDLNLTLADLPAQSTFDKRRVHDHSYIKKRDRKDFSACQYHFNGKQILSTLLHVLQHQRIHTCSLKGKSITYSMNDKLPKYVCDCTPCLYCQKVHKIFNKKSTELIKTICCKQRNQIHDFPKEQCIKGNCPNCGINYILLCLRSHPQSHSFEHAIIKYDQSEAVDKVKKTLIYGICPKTNTFTQFTQAIIKLNKYVNHHTTFIWQFLCKIDMKSMLNMQRLHTHWDYINNPKVRYYERLNNQWSTQNKFAYLAGIETSRINGVVKQKSINYFIKDPKHDFAAAHHIIRKYCIEQKTNWRLQHKLMLKQFRFYSDRGEFLCRGFMFLITGLSHEIKTNVFWDFGAPNHNKDLCDSEGAVSKRAMDVGAEGKELIFHSGEEYVVTAARFCNEHLNSPNKKTQRVYIHVLDDDISHIKCNKVCLYFAIH